MNTKDEMRAAFPEDMHAKFEGKGPMIVPGGSTGARWFSRGEAGPVLEVNGSFEHITDKEFEELIRAGDVVFHDPATKTALPAEEAIEAHRKASKELLDGLRTLPDTARGRPLSLPMRRPPNRHERRRGSR